MARGPWQLHEDHGPISAAPQGRAIALGPVAHSSAPLGRNSHDQYRRASIRTARVSFELATRAPLRRRVPLPPIGHTKMRHLPKGRACRLALVGSL